tara:strand:+ start:593 stop:1219 length:627 start_codon:yes stop_codon:yes gene_type:complete
MATLKGLHARITAELFKEVLEDKGYVFFDGNKSYNINIIGVRNSSNSSKSFDDSLLVIYRNILLEWQVESYQITTDPGPYILRKPINPDGTAILVPDQYRGVYKIGLHGGSFRHTALIQRGGKVKVYRDDDKDSKLEMDERKIQEGMFGINIHRHSRPAEREYVNGTSAGCQVFKNSKEFADFLEVCNISADKFGNSFTYTLLEEADI